MTSKNSVRKQSDDPMYNSVYKTAEVILHIDEAKSAVSAFSTLAGETEAGELLTSSINLLERLNASTRELKYPNSKSPALFALNVIAKDLGSSKDAYAQFAAEAIRQVIDDYRSVSGVVEKSKLASARFAPGYIIDDKNTRSIALDLASELIDLLRTAVDTEKLDDTAKGIVEQAILPQLELVQNLINGYFESGEENAIAATRLSTVIQLTEKVLKATPSAILAAAHADKAFEVLKSIVNSAV